MIRIPSDCNAGEVESLLNEIVAKPGQGLSVPIKIARSASFGVATLLVLAIAKWLQVNSKDTRLVVPTEVLSLANSRDRFAGTLHGMAAVWLSTTVVTADGAECRRILLEAIAPYVLAMADRRLGETVRGPHVLLCCFQPATNEFLRALYSRPERGSRDPDTGRERVTVRSQGEFLDLLLEFQDQASIGVDGMFNEGQLATISAVLFQLFKNADVHTVTDLHGNKYPKSMRGIMVRRVRLSATSEIEAYADDDRRLSSFLVRNTTGRATGSFIEISVFDTGPGMVARWLGRKGLSFGSLEDISLDEEFKLTKNCFELHTTTQNSGGHGDGLDIALKSLAQLSAFMSLRTGRMSLCQDFSSSETRATFDPKHRFPKKRLAATGGTSYTLCIPVPSA